MTTRDHVLKKAREEKVKFLRLQFTDTFGSLKNIAVTSEDLERAMAGNVVFESSVVDGVVSGLEQDILLKPDLATFMIFPWRPREVSVARFICDIANYNGSPYHGCSRSVLKKVLIEAGQMGFEVRLGAKIDFYLLCTDSNGKPSTNTNELNRFYDSTPFDPREQARQNIALTLEEMGYDTGFGHDEAGPGQYKVALKEDSALNTADKLVTLKFIVRTIAQRHRLFASFMPKPLKGLPGSALHLLLFLQHRESEAGSQVNVKQPVTIDHATGHFIAGVLEHARANTAITNPLINSYKRLVSDSLAAPSYIAWSEDSHYSMLRVTARNGLEPRVEMRSPDPACNPYLALAVILKAGLEGIRKKTPQPLPLQENSRLRHGERPAYLPRNLEEALRELSSDRLTRNILGEHIYQGFARVKGEEWERFQAVVHPWELKEYLPIC